MDILADKKRITSTSNQLRMPESLSLFVGVLLTVPWNEILTKTAQKHLSLDFSMTYDVLTPLKFISKGLLNLKHACDTTRVRAFLQYVFMELGTENVIVIGYFRWMLFMFKMSPEEYSNYSDTTGKLAKETADKEQKLLGLCVDELDPSQLFEDLRYMHLVEEDERKKVMNHIPRKQRMEFLIGRLAVLKRNKMLNIIRDHCRKHGNEYLCSEINAIYGGDTGNSNFIGRSGEDFTTDFVLSTQGKLTNEREDEEQRLLLLCADELDPCQFFEDLRNKNLVEEDERKIVLDHIPRKQCMEFLIGRLAVLKRNEMLNILLAHCMKHGNRYLWRKITTIYDGDTANSHFTGRSGEDKSFPGEKVFTADFTISIQESTGAIKVDIQDQKWHFDTLEADKEIVIMGLIPYWETTEEKAVTTAAPRSIIPESRDANEESHQNVSTLDSNRLESSELVQIVSQHEGNFSNDSKLSHDELAHAAGIDADASPNDQDGVIYQRQQKGKLHQQVLTHCLPQLVRDLDVTSVCMYIPKEEVLDEVTVRDILEQTTTSSKTKELIKQIQQRDQDTYEKFKECLVQSKQKSLKDMLEKKEAKLAKEIKDTSSVSS